jgi:hypothetical protein
MKAHVIISRDADSHARFWTGLEFLLPPHDVMPVGEYRVIDDLQDDHLVNPFKSSC